MKVLMAMLVAAAMSFGVSTAFAGSGCGSSKQACGAKASKDCGGCEYKKGSEECAEACAAKKAECEAKKAECADKES